MLIYDKNLFNFSESINKHKHKLKHSEINICLHNFIVNNSLKNHILGKEDCTCIDHLLTQIFQNIKCKFLHLCIRGNYLLFDCITNKYYSINKTQIYKINRSLEFLCMLNIYHHINQQQFLLL